MAFEFSPLLQRSTNGFRRSLQGIDDRHLRVRPIVTRKVYFAPDAMKHELVINLKINQQRLGVSLVATVTIVQAIGIWPATSNLDEILDRRIEILRSAAHGKLVNIALAEIERAKT